MTRLLLIEDNADLAFGFCTSLEVEGYDVLIAEDGERGLQLVSETAPDLIVLDLMLPGINGYQVLRQLRQQGYNMPVLIMTARGEEVDKVQGFRLGADDYVTKPVGVLEFIARVAALLRRTRPREDAEVVRRFANIEIDLRKRTVRKAGKEVELSPMEFDLLDALTKRDGGIVSRTELLKEVWGYHSTTASRTVDTHIAKLRAKLEQGETESLIVTVRKKGYRIEQ